MKLGNKIELTMKGPKVGVTEYGERLCIDRV